MRFVTTCILVLTALGFTNTAKSQDSVVESKDFRIVFEEIQHGFESGNMAAFSTHLGSQVQVTLRGEKSGYYSSNQAYYILESFLKTRKIVSFEFTSVGETEATPYATGSMVFNHKGMREVAQVYVALMKSEEKWVIAEINIY
jgi:hypothetical protein